jgi:hypothetical protein
MTDAELDASYTAICHALSEVGEAQAQRFLAMLCLALLVRQDDAGEVLQLIEQVQVRAREP